MQTNSIRGYLLLSMIAGLRRWRRGTLRYRVENERIDWEKGDLVLLPLHPNEVEHQHFNLDPEKPSVWCAFIHLPIQEYLASDLQQMENSPDFKG